MVITFFFSCSIKSRTFPYLHYQDLPLAHLIITDVVFLPWPPQCSNAVFSSGKRIWIHPITPYPNQSAPAFELLFLGTFSVFSHFHNRIFNDFSCGCSRHDMQKLGYISNLMFSYPKNLTLTCRT